MPRISEVNVPKAFILIFVGIVVFSVFVRVQEIGYSNFQGDEVNPMDFMYEMDNGLWNYLLEQKRGPVQYLINFTNVSLFGYHSEGQIRIPFLLFGVFALYTLYRLTEKIFDKPSAFIAVLLMSVNGLFIAFARITQYQSFMYFLIPIGVLLFIKALESNQSKQFVYAGLIMSIALLAHYDTLSVIPFFIVGFVASFYRSVNSNNWRSLVSQYIKWGGIFFMAMTAPALVYYIPFYLGQHFNTTSGYLENRLLGGGFMPRTKITMKLLTMYIPGKVIYLLFLMESLGLAFFSSKVDKFRFNKIKISKKLMQNGYLLSIGLVIFATAFSFYPIKPRSSSLLVVSSSLTISAVLILSKKVDYKLAALATWFLGAYSFYFFIMKDPRTHVYVAFIPLFILASYGLWTFYKFLALKWLKNLYLVIMLVLALFVSAVNWVIFVDKSPEYPWWDKDLFGWQIYKIKRVRHEKIEGVFGFNNYRGWEQVADLYSRGCLKGEFNSNEKDSISYFYTRRHQKQGGEWGLQTDVDNLVIVKGPHSWEYINPDKFKYDFKLLKVIESEGVPVSYIFGSPGIYADGKLLCE